MTCMNQLTAYQFLSPTAIKNGKLTSATCKTSYCSYNEIIAPTFTFYSSKHIEHSWSTLICHHQQYFRVISISGYYQRFYFPFKHQKTNLVSPLQWNVPSLSPPKKTSDLIHLVFWCFSECIKREILAKNGLTKCESIKNKNFILKNLWPFQMHVQNSVKHLRWSLLARMVNG